MKSYIFTSENIKYTLYFINILLYFTTLYIMNRGYSNLLLNMAFISSSEAENIYIS